MSKNSVVPRTGAGRGLILLPLAVLLACPSERYARPPGPAPRYESAPLAPWTNEATPEPGGSGDEALESEIARALAGDAGPPPGSINEPSRGQ